MKPRNLSRAVTAVVAAGAATMLVACTGGGSESSSGGSGNAETLNIAYNAQPPSLDPHVSTANATADTMRNVFEPLVALDLNNEPQPVLAESIEHNEDYSETTFHLRDVNFHDGSELDAQDVIDSIERWSEYSPAGAFFEESAFESPDDKTVVLKSEQPFFAASMLLADPSQFPAIMPSEVLEGIDKNGLTEYIGTGPYEFGEYQADQHILLTKHDEYISPTGGTDGLGGERTATYENIYYRFVTDPNTRLNGLQTGEYDIATSLLPDTVPQIESNEQLELHVPDAGLIGMVYNKADGELMNDQNLRHAVHSAIDMDAVMTGAYSSDEYYTADGSLGMPGQDLWYNQENLEEYNIADQQTVDEYMEQAGYADEPIRLIATRDYPDHYDAAVVVEQQLKEAGFNVSLEVYDWPTVLANAADPSKYEIYMSAWTDAAIPTKYTFMSDQGNGSTNDAELFNAVDAVNYSDGPESASAAMEELQSIFYDYLPMTKFGNRAGVHVNNTNVEGFLYQSGAGGIVFNTKPAE